MKLLNGCSYYILPSTGDYQQRLDWRNGGYIVASLTCLLCQEEDEDIEHLFFECSFTSNVWNKILTWQGIQRPSLKWQDEVQWALAHIKSKNNVTQEYRMTLAGPYIVYERNETTKIFQHKQRNRRRLSSTDNTKCAHKRNPECQVRK
ncbi:hypothetical protein MTR67_017530 [Solanum verrucosum]|uniref:Reverse transcriptase zinc-binding domain-containing protein n=1 Tax=Solanum verrucosum TaxID=315347 RepID=A0AAF0TSA9_SOLVR|nr:hypothetical protein MTR67_017530 [Solanum verrucosum]